jgi:subtilisin
MATKKGRRRPAGGARAGGAGASATRTSSSVDEMLLAALERGDDSFETGRLLVTFKEGASEDGAAALSGVRGMCVADARDFAGQAVALEDVGDADVVLFPEVGAALIGGAAARERGLTAAAGDEAGGPDSPIESIDPELFVFAEVGSGVPPRPTQGEGGAGESARGLTQAGGGGTHSEYLRGFMRAAEVIAQDLRGVAAGAQQSESQASPQMEAQVFGATWGLIACRVPPSLRTAAGIKVAVLGTGFDLGHPDFIGRPITTATFVGQPVQDLFGHGTHVTGTACGPKAPAGTLPRYGIAFRSSIFVGKVLSNSGAGTMTSILAGMNWAIANKCPVILLPLAGSPSPGPVPVFTAAGQAALNSGCLMIAGSSSAGPGVGSPANSPTVMSVASVDPNLSPSAFSPSGKIEIAAPGRDVFSSWSRPTRYKIISGLASAAAHVAGCAALWADTSPTLRGPLLWKRLETSARPLPFPRTRVGAGLVQAPA